MEMQNVTLSLPKDILLKIKLIAVRQGTSVSGLMTRLLTDIVAREEGYEAAKRRSLKMLDDGLHLGTNGNITWSRKELHER